MKRTKLCSEDIKAAVASFFRYKRQCSVVAFEVNAGFNRWGGELADLLVVTADQHLIMIEVKKSMSDFKRDQNKRYHHHLRNDTGILPVQHFYFAVPKDIANDVAYQCGQFFPYAGVLGCLYDEYFTVTSYRNPRKLRASPLTGEQLEEMQRGQTATLCRLARKVAELKQAQTSLQADLKKYKDIEKLSGTTTRTS